VANDNGFRTFAAFQSQRKSGGYSHGDSKTSRADGRSSGHPRHVPSDVQAAAEGLDDSIFREETQCRQRRVITDARMSVFDGRETNVLIATVAACFSSAPSAMSASELSVPCSGSSLKGNTLDSIVSPSVGVDFNSALERSSCAACGPESWDRDSDFIMDILS
jgi:hypothetical protein